MKAVNFNYPCDLYLAFFFFFKYCLEQGPAIFCSLQTTEYTYTTYYESAVLRIKCMMK